MRFTLDVEDREVQALLEGTGRRAVDAGPAMEAIGLHQVASIQENFRAGGRPTPWAPPKRGGGKALQGKTTRLKRGINFAAQARQVEVGPDVLKYARIHQEGGRILPKKAKALAIPLSPDVRRNPRAYKNTFILGRAKEGKPPLIMQTVGKDKVRPLFVLLRSVTIEARPYALWQVEDLAQAETTLADWLVNGRV